MVAGDVTASDFPEKVAKATAETFGAIDILINNAGEPLVTSCPLNQVTTV